MNAFLRLPPVRLLVLTFLSLTGMRNEVWGQFNGPYKNLVTSVNAVVADTVSGQNLSIYVVSPVPQHGDVDIVLLQTGGSGNPYIFAIKYTPDPGYVGVDTFTVELNYQGGYPFLVYRGYRVSVHPSILTLQSDFNVTTAGTAVTTDVLANDNSSNGPLMLSTLPLINNGTAVITGGNSIKFTPTPGFTGMGHVNYVACDATGACKTGQLGIGVNNGAPVSDTLRIATAKNTLLSMPLTFKGYSVSQAPANGTVFLPNGNSFRYTPSANFTGTDNFVLVSNDYGPPVYKTIILDVLNTPAQNTMAMDDVVFTPKNAPLTFNVRDNDIGNLLVKSWVIPANLPGTISGTSGTGNVTFTPNPGFSGVATFQYKIGNMFVPDLEIATVSVVVGNMHPSAGSFELTTPKSTPLAIQYQIPFTGFHFDVLDAPEHGDCVFYPGDTTLILNGQSVSGTNLLIYYPDNNFVGTDEFEVNHCVTSNGQCQSVKITMNVVNVYSAPAPYCLDNCVWSGDINADGIVNNKDILPLGYYMGMHGPARNNASLEWYGQHSNDWNNPFIGEQIDLKHADTDGNGALNVEDTLAVGFFYNQTHNLTPRIQATSKGLPFYLDISPPNPGVGDLVQVKVSLGDASHPVTNIYGFTFDVSLSPQIVDSALQMEYFNSSWLNRNSPDLWMYKNPRQGRLESVFTRTNGLAASGFGVVGELNFIIIDIVEGGKLSTSPSFSLTIDGPTAMWADRSITAGENYTIDIPLRLQQNHPVFANDFFVYPSPAQNLLQLHLNGDEFMESVSFYDAMGREVYHSGPVRWEHAELNADFLPNGFYVACARTATGQVSKKFQIFR